MIVPSALGEACTYADIDAWGSALRDVTACNQMRGTAPSCTVCGNHADMSKLEKVAELCKEAGIELWPAIIDQTWENRKQEMYDDMDACPPPSAATTSVATPSAFTGLAFLLSVVAAFGLL